MSSKTHFRISLGIILGALIIGAMVLAIPHSGAAQDIRSVSPADFSADLQQPSIHLIDLRTAQEYASGHLADASNIDFYGADFRSQLAALDKNATYAIYCHTGNRSGQTVDIMRQMGFTHVINLQGGIAAWELAQLPITTN